MSRTVQFIINPPVGRFSTAGIDPHTERSAFDAAWGYVRGASLGAAMLRCPELYASATLHSGTTHAGAVCAAAPEISRSPCA